mmetsp:Transcript_4020/g.7312  ORF Transcript_4020/g.7312 Transcript_4020/m.7312 type:complete len:339 (+) Transcript_4020:152-1168(+)
MSMSISTANSFLPSVTSYDGISSQSMVSSSITTASHRRERQLNYKKGVVSSVHHIECRLLYRVLMKIEIPFRGLKMKSNRHRFIKLLYENACSSSPDYESIIGFIKQNLGLYISLHDARQLLLYTALFGKRSEIFGIPPLEDTLRVIKTCPLSVPPFINFKKWSKDVKRLESRPVSDVTKLPGYFSHIGSGGTECVSILSLKEDFREFDEDPICSATSSDTEDAGSDSDSDSDSDDDPKKKNRIKIPPLLANEFLGYHEECSDVREVTLLGNASDDENAEGEVGEMTHEEDSAPKGNEGAKDRKKGVLNLYERSDNHQLNKMILVSEFNWCYDVYPWS